MNFHKSISELYKKVYNAKTKKEANEIVEKLLFSYHIQIEAGINQLNALENSILNPSFEAKKKNKQEVSFLKLNKNHKFLFLFKNEECIKTLKSGGASLEKIAKYLNSYKTPKRRKKNQKKIIINKMDLSRFINERKINAGN